MDKRDLIIFKEKYDENKYLGGIRRFRSLSLGDLKELIDNKFIDLDERQNDGLTVQEFLDFISECDLYRVNFIGYAVSQKRTDCRVTIEGLEATTGLNEGEFLEKSNKYTKKADLFEYNSETSDVFIWFD